MFFSFLYKITCCLMSVCHHIWLIKNQDALSNLYMLKIIKSIRKKSFYNLWMLFKLHDIIFTKVYVKISFLSIEQFWIYCIKQDNIYYYGRATAFSKYPLIINESLFLCAWSKNWFQCEYRYHLWCIETKNIWNHLFLSNASIEP